MILANLKHSVVPTALVSALLLAGCVSPAVTQQVRGHIDSSMEAAGVMNRSLRVEESTLGHKAATNAAAARQLSPIVARRASRPWIGSEMIEISSEDSFPPSSMKPSSSSALKTKALAARSASQFGLNACPASLVFRFASSRTYIARRHRQSPLARAPPSRPSPRPPQLQE